MEGCDPSSANRRILVIGATNRPEDLDEAAVMWAPHGSTGSTPLARQNLHVQTKRAASAAATPAKGVPATPATAMSTVRLVCPFVVRLVFSSLSSVRQRDIITKHRCALHLLSDSTMHALTPRPR